MRYRNDVQVGRDVVMMVVMMVVMSEIVDGRSDSVCNEGGRGGREKMCRSSDDEKTMKTDCGSAVFISICHHQWMMASSRPCSCSFHPSSCGLLVLGELLDLMVWELSVCLFESHSGLVHPRCSSENPRGSLIRVVAYCLMWCPKMFPFVCLCLPMLLFPCPCLL